MNAEIKLAIESVAQKIVKCMGICNGYDIVYEYEVSEPRKVSGMDLVYSIPVLSPAARLLGDIVISSNDIGLLNSAFTLAYRHAQEPVHIFKRNKGTLTSISKWLSVLLESKTGVRTGIIDVEYDPDFLLKNTEQVFDQFYCKFTGTNESGLLLFNFGITFSFPRKLFSFI